MRKPSIRLAILLLVLGLVLCPCAATVTYAVVQIVREVYQMEVAQPEGLIQTSAGGVWWRGEAWPFLKD